MLKEEVHGSGGGGQEAAEESKEEAKNSGWGTSRA